MTDKLPPYWVDEHLPAVRAGIEWLDAINPTLLDEVNIDTLDLGSSCNCVLGHIAHRFFKDPDEIHPDYMAVVVEPDEQRTWWQRVRHAVKPWYRHIFLTPDEAIALGFNAPRDWWMRHKDELDQQLDEWIEDYVDTEGYLSLTLAWKQELKAREESR